MYFVLSSLKLIDNLLSMNHSQGVDNFLLEQQKILLEFFISNNTTIYRLFAEQLTCFSASLSRYSRLMFSEFVQLRRIARVWFPQNTSSKYNSA